MRSPAVLVVVSLSLACYRYAPTPTAQLQAGQQVRVDLTATGVEELRRASEQQVKLLSGFRVIGTVSELLPDSMRLSVERQTFGEGGRMVKAMAPLALPMTHIRGTEIRTIDRRKTTIFGVSLGAAAITTAVLAIKFGGKSSGVVPGNGNPPPDMRIPFPFAVIPQR